MAIARAQTWRLRRSCWPAARLAANACGCHETEPTSCVLFQNRLPLKDSTFRGALDELGVARRETVDVLMLAQDKRPESTLVGIGTPPPDGADSVLSDWRTLAQETGAEHVVWREFTADGFAHHDLLCEHCIRLSIPAVGDFLALAAFRIAANLEASRANRWSRQRRSIHVADSTSSFSPAGGRRVAISHGGQPMADHPRNHARGSWVVSEPLDDGGVGHAAALTHRLQTVAGVALLERVDQRGHDARTAGAQRVSDGDRSAVDVRLGKQI